MAGKDSKIPYVTGSSWDVLAISGQAWTLARSRFGGAEGNRTPDLRIANATLSQLSYGPTKAQSTLGRRNMWIGRISVKRVW